MNAYSPTDISASNLAMLELADTPDAFDTDKADILQVYAELITACEPQPRTAEDKPELTQVEATAAAAYAATKNWLSLHEKQAANPHMDLSAVLYGAKESMRERHAIHADAVEIEAIGRLDGGRWMGPGYYGQGLAVYDDGADEPLMYVPRGLGRETILLLLRTHDAAYTLGLRDGGNEVRDGIANILRRR